MDDRPTSPGAGRRGAYRRAMTVGTGRADDDLLAATSPVLGLALASVAAVRDAAARAGGFDPGPGPDPERVAAAFASDRSSRVDGAPVDGFAPSSGFFRTADGWVRTHANYPHHRARSLALLDSPATVADHPSRDDVATALAARSAQEVEDPAASVGAIAVRVRSADEWRASAPGRAAASGPPVRTAVRDDAAPPRPLAVGPRPLVGLRVSDSTRVIAGPVATRTLASLGADVSRVDPPGSPEIEVQHLDTGQGKRSASLDLATPDGRVRAQESLDAADVLVTGYRPGAVEAFGSRSPGGAVHARVSAWGDDGPWAPRRGFDSIVQAASGIALVEGTRDGTVGDASTAAPGASPAQALDHATGYLSAAAVVDALADRAADGRGRDVDGALART
ncbi:hypothetical protein OY671_004862, partial [Metschnikowia pulcherrima]